MFQKGKLLVEGGEDQLDATVRSLAASTYTMYDNKTVSGNDVIDAISRFKTEGGDLQIMVTTNAGTTTTYLSTGSASSGTLTAMSMTSINTLIQNSQDKSQTGVYINPYGEFYATLVYDVNEEIRGITFNQN